MRPTFRNIFLKIDGEIRTIKIYEAEQGEGYDFTVFDGDAVQLFSTATPIQDELDARRNAVVAAASSITSRWRYTPDDLKGELVGTEQAWSSDLETREVEIYLTRDEDGALAYKFIVRNRFGQALKEDEELFDSYYQAKIMGRASAHIT